MRPICFKSQVFNTQLFETHTLAFGINTTTGRVLFIRATNLRYIRIKDYLNHELLPLFISLAFAQLN